MRRCSMRLPSASCTSWKCTVLDSVAEKTLIGTVTSPNAIVPFQIDLGAIAVKASPQPARPNSDPGRSHPPASGQAPLTEEGGPAMAALETIQPYVEQLFDDSE